MTDARIPGSFPATRLSAIRDASSPERAVRARAWRTLAEAYWMPAYKYIRLRFGRPREEAADLVQGFFAEAIEKSFFEGYDPERARFRTYLRRCLDGYCANQRKGELRQKRGGDLEIVPLDLDLAESEIAASGPASVLAANDVEEYFDREFARSILALSLEELRSELAGAGKALYMELFERYVLADDDERKPGYRELAEEYAIPVTSVTNHLAFARRAFRRIVLEKLRELTATDEEFRAEARALLGADGV